MGLAKVNINIENGNLGASATSTDGTSGLIVTGVTVAGVDNITANVPKAVYSLADAEAVGITADGTNSYAHAAVKEFYSEAPNGTELWVMVVATTVTMEDMLDKDLAFAPVMLQKAGGNINLLAVSRKSATGVTIANGVDEDVDNAMVKGQALAEQYAALNRPFAFLVDGKDFNGTEADLKDYTTASFNRGMVVLSSISASKNQSVAFTMGAFAGLPVQRKISRVLNGALPITEAYFTATETVESLETAWETIANKGYVFIRTYTGKSGYFFSSDSMATAETDDFASMARRRVIDKAQRIAYRVYVDQLDDEGSTDENGNIDPAELKGLQSTIETAIENEMVNATISELDSIAAVIDPRQDVIATSTVNITLSAKPKFYKNIINVNLGLTNPANN